eukprot:TRINITY_DN16302_c1_g1_i1.p1 TRINITY_DN16302_c1_g1~~TRINITY_DN16302_c1_g1_i1.p1  ORF type:complete len:106 (-),score=6.32 TRINITY_DN16302_c1_g1_i1:31-348(-)
MILLIIMFSVKLHTRVRGIVFTLTVVFFSLLKLLFLWMHLVGSAPLCWFCSLRFCCSVVLSKVIFLAKRKNLLTVHPRAHIPPDMVPLGICGNPRKNPTEPTATG